MCENVHHFYLVDPDAVIDVPWMQLLANEVKDAWNVVVSPIAHQDFKLVKIIVQDLRDTPYRTVEVAYNLNGSNDVDAMPPQMAAVVSLKTSRPGRSGRGRSYQGGLCESSNAFGGTLTDATRTVLTNWALAMFNIQDDMDPIAQWGVLSRTLSVCTPIEDWLVDNRWDVQRRRANRRI